MGILQWSKKSRAESGNATRYVVYSRSRTLQGRRTVGLCRAVSEQACGTAVPAHRAWWLSDPWNIQNVLGGFHREIMRWCIFPGVSISREGRSGRECRGSEDLKEPTCPSKYILNDPLRVYFSLPRRTPRTKRYSHSFRVPPSSFLPVQASIPRPMSKAPPKILTKSCENNFRSRRIIAGNLTSERETYTHRRVCFLIGHRLHRFPRQSSAFPPQVAFAGNGADFDGQLVQFLTFDRALGITHLNKALIKGRARASVVTNPATVDSGDQAAIIYNTRVRVQL